MSFCLMNRILESAESTYLHGRLHMSVAIFLHKISFLGIISYVVS